MKIHMNKKHPTMRINETLATFHSRCAEYHRDESARYLQDQNYRDAASHGDLAAIHSQAAAWLTPATRGIGQL